MDQSRHCCVCRYLTNATVCIVTARERPNHVGEDVLYGFELLSSGKSHGNFQHRLYVCQKRMCGLVLYVGAVTDFLFLALHHIFGGGTFLLFAAVSAAGGIFVHRNLPETRGKNLEEVQALMSALYLRRRIGTSLAQ